MDIEDMYIHKNLNQNTVDSLLKQGMGEYGATERSVSGKEAA